jgi:hypothetical protein
MDELEAFPNRAARALGSAIGVFIIALLIVGFTSIWKRQRTQRRRVSIFSLVVIAISSIQAGFILLAMRSEGSGPAWHYAAPDNTFTLTLPSASWKLAPQQTHVADFFFPDSAPILASVLSVTEQSLAEYLARVAAARTGQSPSGDTFRSEEGGNLNGDRYLIQHAIESHGDHGGQIYVAQCLCWLAKPALAVTVISERQGKMFSHSGREVERRGFERQVKAICSSVRVPTQSP